MKLEFTEQQQAFRMDCRAWLQAKVPTDDLGSGDTRGAGAMSLCVFLTM